MDMLVAFLWLVILFTVGAALNFGFGGWIPDTLVHLSETTVNIMQRSMGNIRCLLLTAIIMIMVIFSFVFSWNRKLGWRVNTEERMVDT